MKITLSWLKDYLDTNASLEEIVERLNMLGLVVDDVSDQSKGLEPFRIAHVIHAERPEGAERLNLCKVDTGKEILQIICGGTNVHNDMKVVLAPIDSVIPTNGMKIKLGKIRGIESHGMLCSATELGLEDTWPEGGIIELPADAPIGGSFVEYMGLNDPILDIEVTPNRGDCFGIYGIARDLAAAGVGTLKPLEIPEVKTSFDNPMTLTITEASKNICTMFTGTFLRNVKNQPSPAWMQQRLKAAGMRPISALVDITNYLSHAIGRPMHVYDADKLQGNLHVRPARSGETVLALNDVEYTLDESIAVVADDEVPQGVAGIIGGMASGCTDETTNVFLEAAIFDPIDITMTGRKLNIITDARQRFERGVDAAIVLSAQKIATKFILDHCGGEASNTTQVGLPDKQMPVITFRPERFSQLIGIEVPAEKSKQILAALGMTVEDQGKTWKVQAPTWRHDLTLEEDVIEEIIRVYGYDHIPTQNLPPMGQSPFTESTPGSNTRQNWTWRARRALSARGLHEALTFSFVDEETANIFGGGNPALKLVNSISSELSDMRPSLLPNLIEAIQRNYDRGQQNVNLFEIGKQFKDITIDGELLVAAGVRSGKTGHKHWAGNPRDVDAFDAKADAIATLQACDINTENLSVQTPGPDHYHPGRSGYLTLGPKNKLAAFGELHPRVLANMAIDPTVVGFEVYLGDLPIQKSNRGVQLELSPYQPVGRDFAFIVDKQVPAQDLISAIRKVEKQTIAEVRLFDVFEGETIGANKKSLAIHVRFEPKDGTMTEEMLTSLSNKIIEQVRNATGGELRS